MCYRGCDFTEALWKAKYRNRLPCDTTQHDARRYGVEPWSTSNSAPSVIPRRQPKHGNSITSVKGLGIDQYSIHEVGRHVLTGGLRGDEAAMYEDGKG